MDTLLSNRALGYLSILLFMVAAFFALIEFFATSLVVVIGSLLLVVGLWRLRIVREDRRHAEP
ncbi:MAG: hypothetical protein ACRD0P_33190 [Stackebrandtia sp.]